MKTMNRRLSKLEDRLVLPRFPKPQHQYRDRPLPQSNIFRLIVALAVDGPAPVGADDGQCDFIMTQQPEV
jgi:hypothetical protein